MHNAFNSGTLVDGSIISVAKSGFLVTFLGCRAFCPFSEFPPDIPPAEIADRIRTGLSYKFMIIKLEDPRSVIVSRKKAIDAETLNWAVKSMRRKSHIDGIVKSVVPYGAFVNICYLDALLHKSNIPNGRSLMKDDRIRVRIIAVDGKKISIELV